MTDKDHLNFTASNGQSFDDYMESLLPPLPDEAEGDDRGWIDTDQMNLPLSRCRLKPVYARGEEPNNSRRDTDTERRIKRVAANFLHGIQIQAHKNGSDLAQRWLDQLNEACGIANNHDVRKAAAAIKPEMQTLMQTIAWSEFKREVERISGYEHHPIMLLSDLIEAALNTDDDI